jgi:hypothetical protein
MRANSENIDPGAAEVLARGCSSPVKTATGVWVRCGSRIKSRCESCSELYRKDWAAIARSGVFDGPVEDYRFYLLTLTAPSFGGVHRVPREGAASCRCGGTHDAKDAGLRGVPLEPGSYDYSGQVAWNRDAGVLWDRTRRRMRDRWDSLEYFIVREWQDRGVLHVHAIVRIARLEAPSAGQLREAARTATAVSRVDGAIVEWGAQADCAAFRADGDGAKTIWYLSKALNYVLKDVASDSGEVPVEVWRHQVALADAARRMRCGVECEPQNCSSLVHQRYGSRSQVVSASRRTHNRTGWSFSGLTRTVQRRLRREWWVSRLRDEAGVDVPAQVPAPLEDHAARSRRGLIARGWSAP